MKFINSAVRVASALAVFAVLAVSCGKEAEPVTPGGGKTEPSKPEPVPELDAFEIEAADVTTYSVNVSVRMLDEGLEYYVGVVSKAEYDRLGSDAALIEDDIKGFHDLAELYEEDYSTFVKEQLVYTEDVTGSINDLSGDTEYYVYAFTLDDDYLAGKDLVKTAFRTLKAEPVNCSFGIEVSDVTSMTAGIKVTPSDNSCSYFYNYLTAEEYYGEEYGGDEGIIAKNIELIRGAVEIYQMMGYDASFGTFLTVGEDSSTAKQLRAGTEYIVFAFGLDPSGTGTTAVYKQMFTTTEPEPSSMTFEGEVYDLKFNGAKIQFTPSTDDETYFTDCMDWETFSKFKDDKEITSWVLSEAGESIDSYLAQGTHVVDASEILVSKTKYVAYAFGYNGGATTGVTTVEFTTPEMPTGSGVTVGIDCKIVDGSKYGAEYAGQKVAALTLSPSIAAEHWYSGVYRNLDGFKEYDIIEALRMKGTKDGKDLAFPLQDTDVVVAAVAFDASGRAGALNRLVVKSDGTLSKSVSLKSVRFYGMDSRSEHRPAPLSRTETPLHVRLSAFTDECQIGADSHGYSAHKILKVR